MTMQPNVGTLWRLLGDVGISKNDVEHPSLEMRIEDLLKNMIARR